MLDPAGRIMTWNLGAQRIKGYAPEEIIGRHFSAFYTAGRGRRAAGRRRSCGSPPREGRFEDEGWRVRKDGSRFWANVVITALRDEDGKLLGFSKITRDLTERRRAGGSAAPERGALPAAGRGRERLRDLHARPGRRA